MRASRLVAAAAEHPGRAWVARLHVLLAVQSMLLVLASVNRLWSATDVRVLPTGHCAWSTS